MAPVNLPGSEDGGHAHRGKDCRHRRADIRRYLCDASAPAAVRIGSSSPAGCRRTVSCWTPRRFRFAAGLYRPSLAGQRPFAFLGRSYHR